MGEAEQSSTGAASAPPPSPAARPTWGRRITRIVLIVIGVPLALLVLLSIFDIPIHLGFLKGRIESAAQEALGREVQIQGPLFVTASLRPTAQIEGLRVASPQGWQGADLAALELARLRLAVLPLLSGEIHVLDAALSGLAVNLESTTEGDNNWQLGTAPASREESEAAASPEPAADVDSGIPLVIVDALNVTDAALHRRTLGTDKAIEFRIDEIVGSAANDQPVDLDIKGKVQTAPYSVGVKGGAINALLAGGADWPLAAKAEMVGASLTIDGTLGALTAEQGLDLEFDLRGPDLAQLGKQLDLRLPPLQSFDLSGRIVESAGKYQLADVSGALVASRVSGTFQADTSGAKPHFTGELTVESIDAGPLVAALREAGVIGQPSEPAPEKPASEKTEQSPAALDLDQEVLVLDALAEFEAALQLKIKAIENTRVPVQNAVLAVNVHDGALAAPLAVEFGDTPFEGELNLSSDATAGRPEVKLRLQGNSGDFEQLFEFLTGMDTVEGRFDQAGIDFQASGATLRELIGTSRLAMQVKDAALTYGNQEGERPVEFSLGSAALDLPLGDDISFTAEGALLGLPYTVDLTTGSLIESSESGLLPVNFRLEGGGAKLAAEGHLARRQEPGQLDLQVTGERLGDMAAWIGVSPDADLPYHFDGALIQSEGGLTARIDSARLGSTDVSGEAGVRREGDTKVPFAQLAITGVDPDELAGLMPAPQDNDASTAASPPEDSKSFTIDVPILPTGISLMDADVEVTVDRMPAGPLVLEDLSLAAHSREGIVKEAPFGATIAGMSLAGQMSADLSGQSPALDLRMGSKDMDIGALLGRLGVADGLQFTAEGFELDLKTRGATTREVLEGSTFEARLTGAQMGLGPAGGLQIGIPAATFSAPAGEAIQAVVDGRINAVPAAITLTTDSLASFAAPKEDLEVRVDVQGQQTLLSLAGQAPLPLDPRNLALAMDLKGENLRALNQLLGTALPPIGPYRSTGRFGTNAKGFFLKDLVLEVGRSRLTGTMDVDSTAKPPRLDVALVAESIQIDDFTTEGWSATGKGPQSKATVRKAGLDAATWRRIQEELVARGFDPGGVDGKFGPKTEAAIRQFQTQEGLPVSGKADPEVVTALLGADAKPPAKTDSGDGSGGAQAVPALLSPDNLKRLDAGFTLDVRDVRSGQDRLGRGQAKVVLDNGVITLDPLSIKIPGGDVNVSLELAPGESTSRLHATAKIDRLDYGTLARRIDPASEVGGLLWVDVDLTLQGPPGRMLAGSNGHLNFGVVPEDLNAAIFDLWAVNLVSALVKGLDEEASKVNCVIGRFAVDNGVMRPTAILIDSTRVQASGDGIVDFRAETVEFTAAPRSKTPELFSAQTPVQAKGSFEDFSVGLKSGALVGTTVRMLTSPVTVPIRWVFTDNIPEDGREACIAAWRESAPDPKKQPQG